MRTASEAGPAGAVLVCHHRRETPREGWADDVDGVGGAGPHGPAAAARPGGVDPRAGGRPSGPRADRPTRVHGGPVAAVPAAAPRPAGGTAGRAAAGEQGDA